MRIAAAEPGMETTHENVIVVDENDVELAIVAEALELLGHAAGG